MNTPETTMKLSEAIRLGAMLKPQAFGGVNSTKGTCALGAAFEAAGLPIQYGAVVGGLNSRSHLGSPTWHVVVPPAWFDLGQQITTCPECSFNNAISEVIPHLNDHHKWTRERIADWVATIEAQREQQAELVVPAMEVAK